MRWLVAILLFLALSASGCGGGSHPSHPAPPASPNLTGQVSDASGAPLGGVLVTALDPARAASVSVYTSGSGEFTFPALGPGTYRVRARRIGFAESWQEGVEIGETAPSLDFSLAGLADVSDQLPASYFYELLDWPSPKVRGDFSRACANCHQIGNKMWRETRSEAEWQALLDKMIGYGGVPFFAETRPLLLPTILRAFGPGAEHPRFAAPPPPSGDATRVILREWELDPETRPDCHDLELAEDGTVYTVGGMYTLNPKTAERHHYPIRGGGHSVERAANGDMWITAPGPEEIIKFDVKTHETTHYPQPRIGDDLGSYPHTLRFDDQGRIWYTLTRSNHVARFDPATEEFTYYRLLEADPEVSGLPIAVAYGLDVAPDQSIWWSQLFGHRIGRIDPVTGEVRSWRPPFYGPRRLFVGPDNVVWVPGYGASVLGRFDPKTETWRVYDLPTHPSGGELPYAIAVNRQNGDVWITGSNSDTLIRFRPATEEWTTFELPTPVDFTREIEFDAAGNPWTCTADVEISDDEPGSGRVVQLELLDRAGTCGDGSVDLGEDCDDGNSESCDGCSSACRLETGCGDGAVCGAEQCDDGNTESCDGCSSQCQLEPGAACGDGAVSAACGEECDPPGTACTYDCRRIPGCGDGILDAGEECDDGNLASCDGCSNLCTSETGCGDGFLCGVESCDDGNRLDCDGCSGACMLEVGGRCGDGTVDPTCGEECDPPGGECGFDCRLGGGPLGTRPFSFGGTFHSSALGTSTPLGELQGEIELVAGEPDADGLAPLSVTGPVIYSAPILGGSYGLYCVRIESCQGMIDCDGGTAVGVRVVQDSRGPGLQGEPVRSTGGLGEESGPGAVSITCRQSFVQLPPGGGDDCATAALPPPSDVIYTTGMAEAFFENAAPKVGNGAIAASGEPFQCARWTTEDGAGKLVAPFLVEDDPQAGDVANLNVLDD